MKKALTLLAALLVASIAALRVEAQTTNNSVTLAWDRSTDSTVTGYKLYYTDVATGVVKANNAGNTTSNTVAGLASSKTYSFYCVSYNSSGVESTPSNTIQYTVPSAPPPTLTQQFEAESGTILAPFYVSNGTVQQDVQTDLTSGGRATYVFAITNAGNYAVRATVSAPDGGQNSAFVNIDAEPTDPYMVWDATPTVGFEIREVSWIGTNTVGAPQFAPKVFNLSTGNHTLIVRGREAGFRMDRFEIKPVAPPAPPAPPQNLRLQVMTADRIDVGWDLLAGTVLLEQSRDGLNYGQIASVTGSSYYINTGLRKNTLYYYRARDTTSAGTSPYSGVISGRTLKR